MVPYVPYVQNTNRKFFALVVGVHVAAVAFFGGNRRLFFFKEKSAYYTSSCLLGSEMSIRDRGTVVLQKSQKFRVEA